MADLMDALEEEFADILHRARFQAVVSDLLDAHDLGAPAWQIVDMLIAAASSLALPSRARREWTPPKRQPPRTDITRDLSQHMPVKQAEGQIAQLEQRVAELEARGHG